MLRAGPDKWMKAGVEVTDGALHTAIVVTHGNSDWSMAPLPGRYGEVTVRVSPLNDGYVARVRGDDGPWRTMRVAPFFGDVPVTAGPMTCAPSRAGLIVSFTSWRHTPPDAALHEPPALTRLPWEHK